MKSVSGARTLIDSLRLLRGEEAPIAHGRHPAPNAGLGIPFERERSAMPIGVGSHADRHCKSHHRLAVFYPHLDGAHDDNG